MLPSSPCRFLATLLLIASLGACSSKPQVTTGIPVKSGAAAGYNVLLITLDTVRADRLGCYGYERAETPAIDGLAKRGVRFADAVTAVPITLPSHATIMTGVMPPKHRVRLNGFQQLPEEATTLAEVLRGRGYRTGAVVASVVLDAARGLDQGFDSYDDQMTSEGRAVMAGAVERPAAEVTSAAIRWLDTSTGAAAPFFLWVHYFDPHDPYAPPEPFRSRHAGAPYDGEIAYMDSEIGRLLAHVAELGAAPRTVVVLVADHGEGLGEHGERAHSHLLYESTMRVPLVIAPGELIKRPIVMDGGVVCTADVAPTLLDLVGVAGGLPDGDGQSLVAGTAKEGEDAGDAERAVYMETLWPHLVHGWAPIYALRRHGDKYISAPWPEYYDLARDPGERENLLAGDRPPAKADLPESAGALALALEGMVGESASVEGGASASEGASITESARRQLLALGYAAGATLEAGAAAGSVAPVPLREMIHLWQARSDSITGSADMQARMTLDVQERSVLLDPTNANAHRSLGEVRMLMKDFARAEESFAEAVRLGPGDMDNWLRLAECRKARNDRPGFEEALEGVRKTIASAPPERRREAEAWLERVTSD